MKNTPSISIIIPTLEEEKLISRILNQFTPELRSQFNLEIIVSDGGSTDKTLSIARTLADTVLELPPDTKQNISMGRNVGAAAATGDIFIFINCDTIIDNPRRFFSVMLESITSDRIVAATCAVEIYPEEQTIADNLFHGFYNWYFRLLNTIGMGMGRGECHVMKRGMFFEVGGYNEAIAAGEDYDLFVRLRRKGKVAFHKDLRVFESPRRYRKYGYVKISLFWFLNALSVFFFSRSMHKEWEAVR